MNILLLNGCPKSNGATASILRFIAESVDQSKYNVEFICLGSLDIHYCLGCASCHHTGKCVQDQDDVDAVMQAMKRADYIVIASPSYWGDITGQLKVLIDRCTLTATRILHMPACPPGKRVTRSHCGRGRIRRNASTS